MAAWGADDQVRSTQEELRRRNVFFGDIDGKPSPEYTEAVKRYQKRKGIAATGQGDHDTLRSLGLLPRSPNEPPPKEMEWPAEPVLKSDVHLDPIAEGQELASETGAAPASVGAVAPGAGLGSKPPASAPRRRKIRESQPPPRSREALPIPSRAAFLSEPRGDSCGTERSSSNNYLRAVGRELLKDELQFYADHLDYFGRPQVDRRIVEQKFAQLLPALAEAQLFAGRRALIHASARARGEIVVTYRLNFRPGKQEDPGQRPNRESHHAQRRHG